MTSHWKAIFGVILIFVCGCLSGWLGASVAHYRQTTEFLRGGSEAVSKLLEARVTRNLHLDDTQQTQIHGYFQENLQQRRQLQAQIQPQVQMLNRQTFEEINAVLNPDQRETFHQTLARFKERTGRNFLNPNPAVQSPSNTETPVIGTSPDSQTTPSH